MDAQRLAAEIERIRPDLQGYIARLLANEADAEDVIQTTAVRAFNAMSSAPANDGDLRPWLFRIASNLAVDELRRRRRWREDVLIEAREKAEHDEAFVSMSASLRGSPQTMLIAKEHLVACFVCTLRTLSPERAASLLLREVYGFSVNDTAEILDARPAQVKNWIQEGRRTMQAYYEQRCALVRKEGVCYQCAELADFFTGTPENPLRDAVDGFEHRLRILESMRRESTGRWHRQLFALIDEM